MSRTDQRGRGGRDGYEPRTRIRTRALRIMELSLLGWTQHQIAEDIGVSQPAVSKCLARLELRYFVEYAANLDRHKARHTLRLEHQYAELIRAWEASKADATRKRQRKMLDASGSAGTIEVVVENSHGDPRYLEAARAVLADLRKLWGLDAPQKLDVRAPIASYADRSDEELQQLLADQDRRLATSASEPPLMSIDVGMAPEAPHGDGD